ncbi:MAG: tripartite tricarboxylate transporter substrate binding protein [Burkholderiales bacterium]
MLVICGAVCGGAAVTAAAQPFPSKPIQFLVSFPAGSGTDIAARVVGDKLRERTGQSVVIVNRPGAGATLGAAYVSKANPDGYTIAIAASTELAVAPNTRLNLGYDPRKDLSLRTVLAEIPQCIVAGAGFSGRSVADLVALAKKQPSKVSFASYGAGTLSHLGIALLTNGAGIDVLHVPYKGGPAAHPDVVNGRVQVLWDSVAGTRPLVNSGKLKMLAVTGASRLADTPDVPTVAESGFKGFDVAGWVAAAVPAGTPKPVAEFLSIELSQIVKQTDVRNRLSTAGLVANGSSAAEATARVNAYLDKFALAVKISGYQPD